LAAVKRLLAADQTSERKPGALVGHEARRGPGTMLDRDGYCLVGGGQLNIFPVRAAIGCDRSIPAHTVPGLERVANEKNVVW
jgi:hypothetical protein